MPYASATARSRITAACAYPGIDNDTTWAFDTDVTPPSATFSPVDEATEVVVTTDLVLTFDEDVALGTGDITIQGTGDSRTIDVASPAPDSVGVAGNVVTIGLSDPLLKYTRYTVTMDSGAVTDLVGNAYGITDTDTWNFTTEADALALYTFADGTTNSSDSDAGTAAGPAVFGAGIVAGDTAEISSGSANGLSWGNPDNALYIESIDTDQ